MDSPISGLPGLPSFEFSPDILVIMAVLGSAVAFFLYLENKRLRDQLRGATFLTTAKAPCGCHDKEVTNGSGDATASPGRDGNSESLPE